MTTTISITTRKSNESPLCNCVPWPAPAAIPSNSVLPTAPLSSFHPPCNKAIDTRFIRCEIEAFSPPFGAAAGSSSGKARARFTRRFLFASRSAYIWDFKISNCDLSSGYKALKCTLTAMTRFAEEKVRIIHSRAPSPRNYTHCHLGFSLCVLHKFLPFLFAP